MFNQRYFCNRYFAPRYWAKFGATPLTTGLRMRMLLGVGL